jgi:flagellar basal-body rod protein FlgC
MTDVIGGSLAISASGLRAERLRLDAIASNLANASTTRTPEGGPYKRRNVIFATQGMESDFADTIASMMDDGARRGVAVTDVTLDQSQPRLVFDPGHPDANPEGYVAYPNVNPVLEMVDLTTATRAYEANVQAINAARRMAEAALTIGG